MNSVRFSQHIIFLLEVRYSPPKWVFDATARAQAIDIMVAIALGSVELRCKQRCLTL